jgi:hypothetical protein
MNHLPFIPPALVTAPAEQFCKKWCHQVEWGAAQLREGQRVVYAP